MLVCDRFFHNLGKEAPLFYVYPGVRGNPGFQKGKRSTADASRLDSFPHTKARKPHMIFLNKRVPQSLGDSIERLPHGMGNMA